jgi:hypothetical protein
MRTFKLWRRWTSSLKGFFIHPNLHYLYEIANDPLTKNFITQNANSVSSAPNNHFGLNWAALVDQLILARPKVQRLMPKKCGHGS